MQLAQDPLQIQVKITEPVKGNGVFKEISARSKNISNFDAPQRSFRRLIELQR
jgi:hypothetical protein